MHLYTHTLEGRIPRVFLDASPPRGYVYPRGHRHISNARSRAFQRRSVPWRTPAHETPNGREPSHLCDLRPRFKTAVCALAFPRVVEPGWSRWRSLVREYLLPSVFLSSAASHFLSLSLFLSRSAQRIENAWARLCGYWWFLWFRLVGWTTICRVFLVLGYYTYTIMVVIGSTRFREQSKGSLLVLRCVCCYAAKVLFSRSRYLHMFAYGLRIVPFICLIVKADTSLFRARARSL